MLAGVTSIILARAKELQLNKTQENEDLTHAEFSKHIANTHNTLQKTAANTEKDNASVE